MGFHLSDSHLKKKTVASEALLMSDVYMSRKECCCVTASAFCATTIACTYMIIAMPVPYNYGLDHKIAIQSLTPHRPHFDIELLQTLSSACGMGKEGFDLTASGSVPGRKEKAHEGFCFWTRFSVLSCQLMCTSTVVQFYVYYTFQIGFNTS